MRYFMHKIIHEAITLVLPARCPVTGDIVEHPGMLSPAAWPQINFLTPPFCGCCGMSLPLADGVGDQALCASCIAEPPVFDTARSAIAYDDGSRSLVLSFKHGDKTSMIRSFAPWMQAAAKEMIDRADMIAPVPLHWRRLVHRRYNQAAILARALSPDDAFYPFLLRRHRATPSQGHLSRSARHDNVRGAFSVHPRHANDVRGKRVLIVDDVYTTGATVQECARVLLRAGAAGVDVLTLARAGRG